MPTFTSFDGTRIACGVSGAGSPLLLVHGTTADRSRWSAVLPVLEEWFTVYACDRRGRGESGDAPGYAIEREFEDIATVIDGVGGPVDVVAHSYGALCTLMAAARARNLRRLVLYEPPIGGPGQPSELLDRLDALLEDGDRDGVVTTFLAEVPGVPLEHIARMRSLPSWEARVAAAHTITREIRAQQRFVLEPDSLARLQAPTLLLLGGDSPAWFHAAIDQLLIALPDARIAVMPGQQHTAMDTGPDLLLGAVLPFLAAWG